MLDFFPEPNITIKSMEYFKERLKLFLCISTALPLATFAQLIQRTLQVRRGLKALAVVGPPLPRCNMPLSLCPLQEPSRSLTTPCLSFSTVDLVQDGSP